LRPTFPAAPPFNPTESEHDMTTTTTPTKPCRACGRTLTEPTFLERDGEQTGPALWLCSGHSPAVHRRHAAISDPDPVKCEACGFYVNPDMHRTDVCAELTAEREARRLERLTSW
jgi:hypothetical protein